MIERPSRIVSMMRIRIGRYARKISINVSTSSQTQIETKSLFEPAKCSSACACSLIAAFLLRLVTARQVTTDVHGHDVDHREHKHPAQVDKVPVQATDLDVFVLEFLRSEEH